MTIGLTSEQLIFSFIDNLSNRLNEVKGTLQGMEAGENPEGAKAFNTLKTLFSNIPSFSEEQTIVMIPFLEAFMDTIVVNNVAISKATPHVDA